MYRKKRNEKCWCGSNKKLKKCCVDELTFANKEMSSLKIFKGLYIGTCFLCDSFKKDCKAITHDNLDILKHDMIKYTEYPGVKNDPPYVGYSWDNYPGYSIIYAKDVNYIKPDDIEDFVYVCYDGCIINNVYSCMLSICRRKFYNLL